MSSAGSSATAVVANPTHHTNLSREGSRGGGESRVKGALVLAAERIDRRTALLTGYLRKVNSEGRFQKRYFEIVGQYWVYYKTHQSSEMLCAMNLWQASAPQLIANASDDEGAQCEFSITWDKYRVFRASTPQEAVRWVNAIQQVQALRPPEMAERPLAPPTPMLSGLAKSTDGGVGAAPGIESRDWADRGDKKKRGGGSGASDSGRGGESDGGGGGVCGSCVVQ